MARWILRFACYKRKNDIFDMVKSGQKTIEDRPYNPEKKRNYSQVKPGDTLVICSLDTGEKFEKKATWAKVYRSVREMAENEPVEKIIPGIGSADALVALFEELKKKWGSSYARKLDKYGIVAIGMEN